MRGFTVADETFLTKVVTMDWLGNLTNYKEDYKVFLFHVVCTVLVRIILF